MPVIDGVCNIHSVVGLRQTTISDFQVTGSGGVLASAWVDKVSVQFAIFAGGVVNSRESSDLTAFHY